VYFPRNLNPRNWRLSTRLLLVMLMLTLLPLAVANGFHITQTSRTLSGSVQESYQLLADSKAGAVANLLQEQAQLLTLYANSRPLISDAQRANLLYPPSSDPQQLLAQRESEWDSTGDREVLVVRRILGMIPDELRRFQQELPNHTAILVTDRHGGVASSAKRSADLDQSDEQWWQQAWNNGAGALFIGQPAFDQSGQPGVVIAVPIVDPISEQPVGVLHSFYMLTAAQALIRPDSRPDQPHTLLIGPDNRVIASTNSAEVGRPAPTTLDETDEQLILATAAVQPQIAGATAPGAGWRIVVAQERAAALAPVNGQIRSALLLALGVGLAAVALATLLGTQLARPLNKLASAARRGDLAILAERPVVQGSDEVGQLARSLHELAQRALAARSEIEAANRSLETVVAERTAKLHAVVQNQQELLSTQAGLLQQIAEMATPVLPVLPGVVVMPLIGTIEGERASNLAGRLLMGVEQRRARVALIDITGVPLVDTLAARALLNAVQGVRLLGAQPVLVGVQPEIAQTLVSLGMDLSDIATTSNLEDGLVLAARLARKSGVSGEGRPALALPHK
jgi:anti-anti-sigma regulatory factor/HAMP domain-containing protein